MSKEILAKIKKENITHINLQFSDIFGIVKNITIPHHKFATCIKNGTWFDGSSIKGFARISESDMFLSPDLATFRVIPWYSNHDYRVARVICDVYKPNGDPFEGDPRYVLKRLLEQAKKMGYKYYTGPELEFFLFKREDGEIKALPHDKGSYFDLTMDMAYKVREEMMNTLEKMGIEIESSHHEVAPGSHELSFKYDDALATADNAMTLRYVIKAVAAKHGLHATFMPKPVYGINGSGMHVHQSLFDIRTKKNIFYNGKDPYLLSEAAYQFIAGQLKHIKEASALVSPLVNSYKRLIPGYEAPVYITWARKNRSSLIRVPETRGNTQSTRVEIRCPDPSANPYLAFAALLAMGLHGINKKYKAPKPVEENVYNYDQSKLFKKHIETLPHSLWSAISHLKNSKVMKEGLGEYMFKNYIEAKTKEWDDYRTHVTDWEIDRYLEVY